MKITEEKGITLMVLVITIVILLIIASIGINSGMSTIEKAKYNSFKSEVKLLQTKVNELYEKSEGNENNYGTELTEEQKNILNKSEISDIIYQDKTDDEKKEIISGFKYFNTAKIKEVFEIEGIKIGYLINIEKRLVIREKPIKYEEVSYYMLEQTSEALYNVEYNNKNSEEGNFEVSVTEEDNRWKVEIQNINHEGYIDNWQIKYKEQSSSYWNTTNDLIFYIKEEGIYNINVSHGKEVDLGTQNVTISKNYILKYNANANNEYVKNMPENVLRGEIEELTISDKQPEREGYEFKGWSLLDEATEATYQPGSTLQENLEETINLYAIWEQN